MNFRFKESTSAEWKQRQIHLAAGVGDITAEPTGDTWDHS